MNLFADVFVKPVGDLAETARLLGDVLGGLNFVEAQAGRYDEYPAFVAERDGLHFALLGVPDPDEDVREEPTNDFALMVEPVVHQEASDAQDMSETLIARIQADGRLNCWSLK